MWAARFSAAPDWPTREMPNWGNVFVTPAAAFAFLNSVYRSPGGRSFALPNSGTLLLWIGNNEFLQKKKGEAGRRARIPSASVRLSSSWV